MQLSAPGRDSVQVIDIGTDPLAPRNVVTLALDNTIAGPPTNLAITADEKLALVANSMNVVEEGGVRRQVPDDRLFVIDVTTTPPKLIDTLRGLPEGAVFSADGKYLYIGNFIDRDVTILRVEGDTLVPTGKSFGLAGHPAAMRGRLTH